MRRAVAVITDATSSGFFFRNWHAYYGRCFGAANLFVVTYQGLCGEFRDIELGGVWETPHRYNDALRARLVTSLVATLLTTHNVVVRCDVDEFLLPDLRKHAGLADYIAQLDLPYVTARGIDLVEEPADPALDYARPVIGQQRRSGIRSAALNKTCITSVPLTWSEGFHATDVPPQMDELFLFHMKFADIKGRMAWFNHMSEAVAHAGAEGRYFSLPLQSMLQHQAWLLRRPRVDGWFGLTGDGFDERFLETVVRNPRNGIYAGTFLNGDVLFDCPPCFAGAA